MRRLWWACVFFILSVGMAVAQQARERQADAELRDGRTETPADLPEDAQINQQRWQWFTWQRTYPQGVIPRNARSQALRQMMRMEQLQLQAGATASADLQPRALTSTWKISGPAPLATP